MDTSSPSEFNSPTVIKVSTLQFRSAHKDIYIYPRYKTIPFNNPNFLFLPSRVYGYRLLAKGKNRFPFLPILHVSGKGIDLRLRLLFEALLVPHHPAERVVYLLRVSRRYRLLRNHVGIRTARSDCGSRTFAIAHHRIESKWNSITFVSSPPISL